MAGKVDKVPKAYSFSKPPPVPLINDIFNTTVTVDSAVTEDVTEEGPVEQKPKWLVRGDLSDSTSVEDMLNMRYSEVCEPIHGPSHMYHLWFLSGYPFVIYSI